MSNKIRFETIRIYLVGQNLVTLTKYPGLDPEMTVSNNSAGEGDRAAGIDWGTYPTAVSLSLGLQFTF
jgi:TonB-dependent starch-binding outer membrane protein SusC